MNRWPSDHLSHRKERTRRVAGLFDGCYVTSRVDDGMPRKIFRSRFIAQASATSSIISATQIRLWYLDTRPILWSSPAGAYPTSFEVGAATESGGVASFHVPYLATIANMKRRNIRV
jgi:hypothetical protein